jgi:hypothetical protein
MKNSDGTGRFASDSASSLQGTFLNAGAREEALLVVAQGASKVRKGVHPLAQRFLGIPCHALRVFDERNPDEVVDWIVLAFRQDRPVEVSKQTEQLCVRLWVLGGATCEISGVSGHVSEQHVGEQLAVAGVMLFQKRSDIRMTGYQPCDELG